MLWFFIKKTGGLYQNVAYIEKFYIIIEEVDKMSNNENIKQKENTDISVAELANNQRQKQIETEANKLIEENFNALTELSK